MTKNFSNPNDSRTIEIKIENGWIDFGFIREEENQWFYDIPCSEWKEQYPRWQDHMREKSWFTKEMANFINNPF